MVKDGGILSSRDTCRPSAWCLLCMYVSHTSKEDNQKLKLLVVLVKDGRSASEFGNPMIPNPDVLAVVFGDNMNEMFLKTDALQAQVNESVCIPSSM